MPETAAPPRLAPREVRAHELQRFAAGLCAPLWVPLAALYLRFRMGYRIRDRARLRAEFARIRSEAPGPLLICANHLTLIDSMLIAWALVGVWRLSFDWDAFPWNTPERRNFAARLPQRILVWLAKCIPIVRGGSRAETAAVLDRVTWLLARGELALLFPEGGRSRSGRVDPDSGAWGVGRIVGALPGCRVLCVYLRGDAQHGYGDWPASGDAFSVELACIEPKSDHRGVRRSRDLARQITAELARMEAEYFDGRQ